MMYRGVSWLSLSAGVVAIASGAVDVTGVWRGSATDPQGDTHPVVLTLKVDGDSVRGTVLGPPPEGTVYPVVQGRMRGDTLLFTISYAPPDDPADVQPIAFSAVVSGNRMVGTATIPNGDVYGLALARDSAAAPGADLRRSDPANLPLSRSAQSERTSAPRSP